MDFAKFKRLIQDIDTTQELCDILNDIINREIIKDNDQIYIRLILSKKDNDFVIFSNFLNLFKKEKLNEKLIWERDKKSTQANFIQINSITQRDHLKYCEKNILRITNQIEVIEFGITYLTEKIEELKKEYGVNVQPSNNSSVKTIEEPALNPIFKKESIQTYCLYNRTDDRYMIKYLDELNDIFHFDDTKTQKQIFGAVCLILLEKEEGKKKIFKDVQDFTHLATLLSEYWNYPLPKGIRMNKYKDKANKLKEKYVILERKLL